MVKFNCSHCELDQNPDKLTQFLQMLEEAFEGQVQVVAVLEIGSFAKGEAVPASDIDTRVYVQGGDRLPVNVLHEGETQVGLAAFLEQANVGPVQWYDWWTFNEPVYQRISERLGQAISFGFMDDRHADFLFGRLDTYPTAEHSMLFQSNVLYDPEGVIRDWRAKLEKRVFPSLVKLYEDQARRRANGRLETYLAATPYDEMKLQESGQVQWVAQAVRCIREAVGARTYAECGAFTFRRPEVMAYVLERFPGAAGLLTDLYTWKCDLDEREALRRAYVTDSGPVFAKFRALTPQVQSLVGRILQ